MEPIRFDQANPKKNRLLLEQFAEDCDFDYVEGIDPQSRKQLFFLTKEQDEIAVLLCCYFSMVFAKGESEFLLGEKMKEAAQQFFGQKTWEQSKSKFIQFMRSAADVEISLG